MSRRFADDYEWSERFIPTMKRLVGPYLLTKSTIEQDTKEATDLVVLCAHNLRIACRVRMPGFYAKWPDDFTVRYRRLNGVRTEYAKIMAGWGDWFFYGHAVDDTSLVIEPWWIIDLNAFRRQAEQPWVIPKDQVNTDQATVFRAFKRSHFKPPFLIGSSEVFWPSLEREVVKQSATAPSEAQLRFLRITVLYWLKKRAWPALVIDGHSIVGESAWKIHIEHTRDEQRLRRLWEQLLPPECRTPDTFNQM